VKKPGRLAGVSLALAWCALQGCGGSSVRVGSNPAASVSAAGDLLPSDLDIVVRIDWPRLRSSPLYPRARETISAKASDRLARLGPVLDDARAVLIGLRIMSDGIQGDGVFVVEGENTHLDPNDLLLGDGGARFRAVLEVPDMAVFERFGDLERADAALVAVLPRRGIVIGTVAEADALRRTLRSGPDPSRLEPPARGLVSFAGRVGRGADVLASGAKGPLLRRISDGLTGLLGSADLSGGSRLAIEADLVYATESNARAGQQVLEDAGSALESLGPRMRAAARAAHVSRHDRIVTVRAEVALEPGAGPP
jgi:hypothetical protein